MENEKNIEKIYDLIERYNFNELSEDDQSIVLKSISREDYDNMRSTVNDTKDLFSIIQKTEEKQKKSAFKRLIKYPIELYKLAAVGLLLFAIGFLLSKFTYSNQEQLLAMVDTVYVEKIDTMIIEKITTKEIIKEKIVYQDSQKNRNERSLNYYKIKKWNTLTDCSIDICPDDMNKFREIKTKGDISKDSALTDFIVMLR